MGGHAWVTLATNDSYSLGALVLAHSLKQVGTQQQLAVLITPGVTGSMRTKLSEVFNVVVEVNLLDSKDETNLRLLKRPELGVTFTKLHCWRLTQFDKCVFLDADTLVLENCDELFDREELSAAPDIGWPDCFNSGVFVFRPSMETYEKLTQFALERGSFDGGDQGLLNLYFSDWAHKDISKHLPFIYNMASTACYSYLPAFKQFGKNAKIIHFIGASKPWLQYFDTETRKVHPAEGVKHLQEILQLWWNIFCNLIHPSLSPEMAGLAGAFAKLTLGSPRTSEQQALDDHLRRQGWEVGNIDYLGRDSFDNIWNKICQTLSSAPEQTDTIKEPSSPTVESKPVGDLPPVEVKSDEQSMDVASSEVQPVKQVVEAEPAEILPRITQAQVAQPQQSACDQISVTEQIKQMEAVKLADPKELKTEAQAAELPSAPAIEAVEVPQGPKVAPAPAETPAKVVPTPTVETQPAAASDIPAASLPVQPTSLSTTKVQSPIASITPELEPPPVPPTPIADSKPIAIESPSPATPVVPLETSKPTPEQPAKVDIPAPASVIPQPAQSPPQPEQAPVAPAPSPAEAPVKKATEKLSEQAPVAPLPPPSEAPVIKTVEQLPEQAPVAAAPPPAEASAKKSAEKLHEQVPVAAAPPLAAAPPPAEALAKKSAEKLPEQAPVAAAPLPAAAAPPTAEAPAKKPAEKLPEQAPVAPAVCPAKKTVEKLDISAAAPSEPAAPKVASAPAPSPPVSLDKPLPEQVKGAKGALKVETTVPATQTSSGPTPPPRKSSGGTKKATKPKK